MPHQRVTNYLICLPKLSRAEASCCNPWSPLPAAAVCSERLINNDEISCLSGLPLWRTFFNDDRSPAIELLPKLLIHLSMSEAPSVGDTLPGLPLRACTV